MSNIGEYSNPYSLKYDDLVHLKYLVSSYPANSLVTLAMIRSGPSDGQSPKVVDTSANT